MICGVTWTGLFWGRGKGSEGAQCSAERGPEMTSLEIMRCSLPSRETSFVEGDGSRVGIKMRKEDWTKLGGIWGCVF